MKQIINFKKIGSTHEYLKKKARIFSDFTVVLADIQTAGRGQFERKWHSSDGGLYFSVILKPRNINLVDIPLLTYAMALSITSAVENLFGLKPSLKWPNDVMMKVRSSKSHLVSSCDPADIRAKYKKLAGILTESSLKKDSTEWIVISAGINVNNIIPASLRHLAVSISAALGKQCDKTLLLAKILKNFEKYYLSFARMRVGIVKEYTRKSMIVGKEIIFYCNDTQYHGKVAGFTLDGALKLSLKGNIKKTFYSGKVKL
ncbi:MAG: Bifunctional ligase/repressor BirA [Elusimicrobia bacterium ADurb.Bin231]|nr:MAG: Bifunctional ligase/repressor BirA [Elusimicrobia bacterium ADurb.Bin231]